MIRDGEDHGSSSGSDGDRLGGGVGCGEQAGPAVDGDGVGGLARHPYGDPLSTGRTAARLLHADAAFPAAQSRWSEGPARQQRDIHRSERRRGVRPEKPLSFFRQRHEEQQALGRSRPSAKTIRFLSVGSTRIDIEREKNEYSISTGLCLPFH